MNAHLRAARPPSIRGLITHAHLSPRRHASHRLRTRLTRPIMKSQCGQSQYDLVIDFEFAWFRWLSHVCRVQGQRTQPFSIQLGSVR